MGSLVDLVATDPLAIGYSVYYWITFQYPPRAYGVVSVDGVAPSRETIASRTYPFTAEVWMVTRADLDPSSRAAQLRDWLRGPEGQGAVGRSGYVPYAGQ